jgi:DNA-binding MarR family transcriptional regulator
MLLWNVALAEGSSQRELADSLHLPATRIVGLVDMLEKMGLVERRSSPHDMRRREIHLTRKGRTTLERVMAVGAAHEADFTRMLKPREREVLIGLLTKIAGAQGLIATVHPDF